MMYSTQQAGTRRHGMGAAGVAVAALRRARLPVRLSGLGVIDGAPVAIETTYRTRTYNFGGSTIQAPDMETEGRRIMNNWEGLLEQSLLSGEGVVHPDQCAQFLTAQLQLRAAPLGAQGELASVIPMLCSHYRTFYAQTLAWMATKRQGWAESNPQMAQTYAQQNQQLYNAYIDIMPATSGAGGGNTTAYSVPAAMDSVFFPNLNLPAPTGGGSVTAQGLPASVSTAGASGTVTITLRNISRPGRPLSAGDQFELLIQGPPNQPVSIAATQDGRNLGVTPFGSTDAAGLRVLRGTMTENERGAWVETVMVGNSSAQVSFVVSSAPSIPAGGAPASSAAPSSNGGGGSTMLPYTDAATMPAVAAGLPSWAIPAALAAAAFMFFKR